MTAYSRSYERSYPFPIQFLASLTLGSALFLVLVLLITLGYQLIYAGRIFPGVVVAGVDLSGLTPAEAATRLNQALSFPIQGKIVFRDGANLWIASPMELGMVFDASSSAQAAYRVGRGGGLFQSLMDQERARRHGIIVPPVIIFDQRLAYTYLNRLAEIINRPAVEATLRIEGMNVIAEPGQIGRFLDVDATLRLLSTQLQQFHDTEVPLVIVETRPTLLDVSAQAEIGRRILSAPLQLVLPNPAAGDPGPWIFEPAILAEMLTIRRVNNSSTMEIQVGLESEKLAQRLIPIAAQVNRNARNARFYFDDNTRQLVLIESAATGRVLDIPATLTAINQALLRGEHTVSLVLREEQPQITDTATAESLGIRELVAAHTTYFRGSSAERMQNIRIAAARFHGIFVAPGETFSMGKALGNVSLDNGFTEAWIIYGGRTIKGVGGGVCQVSTTLFRTVFFAGFPIVERHSHAYRVSYYEQTASGRDPNLAGMDATVYFPLVDFKFINDTPYWLLMETYFNPVSQSLTWKFYSTSDGRTVTYTTTGPINVVPAPPPRFELNPELPPGQIKQVDWAAEGADVTVERTVWKNGAVYFTDRFITHYQPWQAVCQYGPETEKPEKQAQQQGLCQPLP